MEKRYNKLINNEHSQENEFVLVQEKDTTLWLIFAGVFTIIIGIVFVVIAAGNPELCLYSPFITRILGIFLTIIGLYSTVDLISSFINPKKVLTANENGLYLYQPNVLIPWDCVKEFSVKNMNEICRANRYAPDYLFIYVRNLDEIIAHLPFYKKLLLKSGDNSFHILPYTCGYKAEYVKYILQEYIDKYKINH